MNREIKFRAWVKDRKAIFEVILINYATKKVTYLLERVGHLLNIVDEEFNGVELMQYTGLKDMKGKEIYEGDILFETFREEYFKVVFENGSFRAEVDEYSLDLEDYDDICEVVGNIYENAELMEDE